MKRTIAAASALPLSLFLAAAAPRGETAKPNPSFACSRAQGTMETDICSDVGLADLDRRLALLYAEARREAAPDTAALVKEQRAWLKERDECKDDGSLEKRPDRVQCLTLRYEIRAKQLIVGLPVLERLKRPVSEAAAERVVAVFHLMTPDELYEATSDTNRDALGDVSCRFFTRFPHEAAVLFAANSYSSRDAWSALCGDLDVATAVPATAPLLRALETIEGAPAAARCLGTMQYGVNRTQTVARILALVDGAPDMVATDREREEERAAAPLPYTPDVAHWALQGDWERSRYAELRLATSRARPALVAEYARRFHLNPHRAERLADFHIRRLTDVYTGRSGASSTLSYYSLCLDLPDLDAYLASGKPPAKVCPYAEFADPTKEATLRRLLGLAIVNGYPTSAVKRLIAAGAQLDPPDADGKGKNESRESLLMLAAKRTDVLDALLAAGADPNRGNDFGKTALMYAVQEGNLEGVRRLLAAGAKVDAATATDLECTALQAGGRTALIYAAWQATPEIARALLDAHADAKRADTEGKGAAAYLDRNSTLSPTQRSALRGMLRARD